MVICLELGAYLHMAQLMPVPLTVSCFSEIQIGIAFLVPAHPGVCVCVCVCVCVHACVRACDVEVNNGANSVVIFVKGQEVIFLG